MNYKFNELKLFITSSDNSGCGYFRTVLPHKFLSKYHPYCEHSFGFPPKDPRIQESDVIFLQRAVHEVFLDLIPQWQKKGKKIVYDLDDNIHSIPASNLSHNVYKSKVLKTAKNIMECCDAMVVSTIPMMEFYSKMLPNQKFFVLENHMEDFDLGPKPKNNKIRIGWAGSYTHAGDFDNHLVETLRFIHKEYKDRVEIFMMGYHPKGFYGIYTPIPWVETLKFHEELFKLNFDIGFIVANDNEFNRCKSNLKFLEFSLSKTVSISHNIYPYANTIEHGKTGFLIENPKTDWKKYFVEIIENEKKRIEIAENANQFVRKNYTWENDTERILTHYNNLFDYLFKN